MSHRHRHAYCQAGVIMALAIFPLSVHAQGAPQASALSIGPADIGGVVTSAQGPEAGVWVIAETTDLPTTFAKIVVTDDAGRYVIPALPSAIAKPRSLQASSIVKPTL